MQDVGKEPSMYSAVGTRMPNDMEDNIWNFQLPHPMPVLEETVQRHQRKKTQRREQAARRRWRAYPMAFKVLAKLMQLALSWLLGYILAVWILPCFDHQAWVGEGTPTSMGLIAFCTVLIAWRLGFFTW